MTASGKGASASDPSGELGHLLLEGGAEFGGAMSEPDLAAIERAGGLQAPIVIFPTAAAPDHNDERAGAHAVRWFRSLGASRVEVVPVIDTASANDHGIAQRVRGAKLIYMLGGFPRHLAEILRGSRVWEAALQAYQEGTVLGGSSAGAMVLCSHYYDPESADVRPGLNLLPECCIIPHHDRSGRKWASILAERLPASVLIGIDERTGILGSPSGQWTVSGAGKVTLYRGEETHVFPRGAAFALPEA